MCAHCSPYTIFISQKPLHFHVPDGSSKTKIDKIHSSKLKAQILPETTSASFGPQVTAKWKRKKRTIQKQSTLLDYVIFARKKCTNSFDMSLEIMPLSVLTHTHGGSYRFHTMIFGEKMKNYSHIELTESPSHFLCFRFLFVRNSWLILNCLLNSNVKLSSQIFFP